jgi:hypothetical protein
MSILQPAVRVDTKVGFFLLLSQQAVRVDKTLHVLLGALRKLTAFLTANRHAGEACVLSHILFYNFRICIHNLHTGPATCTRKTH